MLNVTSIVTFLNYNELITKNIIPDLISLCDIPINNNKLYNVKILKCEHFMGNLVENILFNKILDNNFDIENYYKRINPGYHQDLNYLWPNYNDDICKCLSQLTTHLYYTNNIVSKINLKVKCSYAKIVGEVDLIYNNQLCEIKSNIASLSNLQTTILQCLIYVCILRYNKHNIRYVSLIYAVEKRIYTFDLLNWNHYKLMIYLYYINKKL
jgi:hypothetical protein